MRAVTVTEHGGPSTVRVRDIDAPVRGDGDVMVEVKTVAPAYTDLLLTKNEYQVKPDLPFVLGSDFAGTVVEADLSSGFHTGDRVAGCLSYGGASELVAVAANRLYPLPSAMSYEEAAAIPSTYLTAYFALKTRGNLEQGDWVYVTGASGGVGHSAIQVARGLGARVVGQVSQSSRSDDIVAAGALFAVTPEDLPQAARDLTEGAGFDLVLDVVGGDVTNLLRLLAPYGRLMIVGFASGSIPTVKVNRLLLTNTDVRGVESSRMFRDGLTQTAWKSLMDMYARGVVVPRFEVAGTFDDFGSCLARLDARSVSGRLVVTI